MRRGDENSFLINEETGEFIGINLGSSFCAEHEWGIEELKQHVLGVSEPSNLYGIERRRCKPNKEHIALKEDGDTLNLIMMRSYSLKYLLEHKLDDRPNVRGEWTFHGKEDLVTAWNEGSCMVRVKGEENFKKLRELHDQLLKGNVAVWIGGGGVFKNGGLCFAIIDKIPQRNLDEMRDADLDREALQKASDATGIKAKIDAANSKQKDYYKRPFGYYALAPRWAHEEEKKSTKYSVIYWLNPQNQDKVNYGWFSVEDLEQWLENKGRIPKKEGRK